MYTIILCKLYRRECRRIKQSVGNPYNYFVNNGEFFFEGQILRFYADCKYYVGNVKIEKFIKHYRKKTNEPYICVSIRNLDGCKTHITTYNAKDSLGKFFSTKNFDFLIDKM